MIAICLLMAQPPVGEPTRIELTVKAAPGPVPALRFALLPKLGDRVPGNAAVGYFRAALLRPAWPRDPKAALTLNEQWARWDDLGPTDLPPEDVRGHLKKYRDALREFGDAARADRCDWQQAGRLAPADIEGFLNTVQVHRELTRLQSLKIKLDLADGKFDDAFRDLQTGFQHAKHVGEGPGVIQLLVGSAMTQIMLSRTVELVRTPGSPNLYWALTALPRPYLDPAPALDAETLFATSFIAGLKDLEAGPVTEDAANRALDTAFRELGRAADADELKQSGLEPFLTAVGRAALVAGQGPPAKKDLIARGWAKKDVDAMPGAQAILLRAAARHRELWDEQVKQFHLPTPQGAAGMAAATARAKAATKLHADDVLFTVMSLGFPALQKVYEAQARLERKLAHLRAVEAVRLHAALSGVPEKLADATAVPVPEDPRTGKPFEYAKTGPNAFTLTAPAPPGEPTNFTTAAVYAVTLK